MAKTVRSAGQVWRGLLLEGLAILAVIVLVTSGRVHSIESRSAELRGSGMDADDEALVSDDAVERQLRRASTLFQQMLKRHWQRLESDFQHDTVAAESAGEKAASQEEYEYETP